MTGKLKVITSWIIVCFFVVWGFKNNERIHVVEIKYNVRLLQEIKIILISDLHDHVFDEDNQVLIDMIHDQNPDLIFMLGDFINDDSEDEAGLLHLASALREISPVYYALGNHEIEYMDRTGIDLTGKIESLGVEVLDLEYEDIVMNGNKIRIGGMYDYAFALDGNNTCNPDRMKPEVYSFLSELQDTDSFKLMLSHRPESFILGAASKTWDIDLVVSGHTHGGQVVIPFLGDLWAPEQQWFPEYVHGFYEKDNLDIFITSGLSSNKKLLPRFNNPAEIAVLTLLGE